MLGAADDLELSGVPLPSFALRPLIAESLGVGAGAGFLPIGRLTGGVGALGLAFAAAPFTAGGGGGGARTVATGGGGGGCGSSLTYADGAQPSSPVSSFLVSHHPMQVSNC